MEEKWQLRTMLGTGFGLNLSSFLLAFLLSVLFPWYLVSSFRLGREPELIDALSAAFRKGRAPLRLSPWLPHHALGSQS